MQPITTYNPLIPAPIIIHDKLVNEYFALLDHLIFIASQKPIGAPPCPNAIKYGTRTAHIVTTFGFTVPIKIQRYKCPSGEVTSVNIFTIPNGRYDIRIIHVAVVLYTLGLSAADTASIIELIFGVRVSSKTILEWVRYVGLRGFEEHRKKIEEIASSSNIAHVEMDELYLTVDLDKSPYAITLVVDPNTSLVIDVYVFVGSQITTLDVLTVVNRNKKIFEKAKFMTTDGAKAYAVLKQQSPGRHIICLQHVTRSKRKEKMVINLIESLVDRERDLLISEAERQVKRWLDELKRQLEFVLPPVRTPLKLFKEQLIERAEDEANRILDEYKRRIKSYLEAYRAYIHRRLYASQHAALVGALLPKRENQNRRKEQDEDEITTNILYYSNIAATTAVVEGLNRVLRGRIRKSLNYRNLQLVESVAKLIVLNHNTRVLCDGKTPYEHVGIDVSDMEYNPFKSLGRVYDRIGYYYDLPEDAGRVTIRREVYRRYRKKTVKLLRPTFELPSTDDKVNWAIWVRDNILKANYL